MLLPLTWSLDIFCLGAFFADGRGGSGLRLLRMIKSTIQNPPRDAGAMKKNSGSGPTEQMRQRSNGRTDNMYGNIESGRGGGMSSHDANANIMVSNPLLSCLDFHHFSLHGLLHRLRISRAHLRRGHGILTIQIDDFPLPFQEQQNNERISELSDQVARLKGLTIDIGNEVREQNSLLDNMGDGFTNVGDMLTGTLARMGVMLDRGGAKHMCYLVAFVVFVMVFLYWLVR